jgi:hypothetical protein
MRSDDLGKARRVHPHAWLWEPLEADPGFVLSSMFGVKVAYLDSRLVLGFAAKEEPWRGVLVCTEREHQEALRTEFPALSPHPILPKWLYLPESSDAFEGVGERLVPTPKKKRKRTTVVGRARR